MQSFAFNTPIAKRMYRVMFSPDILADRFQLSHEEGIIWLSHDLTVQEFPRVISHATAEAWRQVTSLTDPVLVALAD